MQELKCPSLNTPVLRQSGFNNKTNICEMIILSPKKLNLWPAPSSQNS